MIESALFFIASILVWNEDMPAIGKFIFAIIFWIASIVVFVKAVV